MYTYNVILYQISYNMYYNIIDTTTRQQTQGPPARSPSGKQDASRTPKDRGRDDGQANNDIPNSRVAPYVESTCGVHET